MRERGTPLRQSTAVPPVNGGETVWRVGEHLRHVRTGKTGVLMGCGNSGNMLVMEDGSQGCCYLSYPREEWTRLNARTGE